MKGILEWAGMFIRSREWKTMAGLKFCLCSGGILLGLAVPGKSRKKAAAAAGSLALTALVPLMVEFLGFALEKARTRETLEK